MISINQAWTGVKEGLDVYLFLTGMMLLSETAEEEGLFDYLASKAIQMAKGSSIRLFGLIFIVGIFITIFLSNDATAVVLTPAVAAAKAAKIKKPLPYLLICAFIANAASFVLPISNPANLVIYGKHLLPLMDWLRTYTLPSIVCIVSTYFLLLWLQRKKLPLQIAEHRDIMALSRGSKLALGGIVFTAIAIVFFSALNIPLGLPTCIVGILSSVVVIISQKKNPIKIVKDISWSVLPLVAGLFVIVEALKNTFFLERISGLLRTQMSHSITKVVWWNGILPAYSCNLMNNLPAGLITGHVIQTGNISELVKSSALVGIDLGPNLSVTGSLATILWLSSLKREELSCSA